MIPHNGSDKARWVLLFLLFLLQPFSICGQEGEQDTEYSRTLSISQWIEEMAACEKPIYKLEDAKIVYRPEKGDSIYSFSYYEKTKGTQNVPSKKEIDAKVRLFDVKFPGKSIFIQNLEFRNTVYLFQCEGRQIRLFGCGFKKGIDLDHTDISHFQVHRSDFEQRVRLKDHEGEMFHLRKCRLSVDSSILRTKYIVGDEKRQKRYHYLVRVLNFGENVDQLVISGCSVEDCSIKPVIAAQRCKFEKVVFHKTDFGNAIVDFPNTVIEEGFQVEGCNFNKPFGTAGLSFPKANTQFRWKQLDSVGLGLYKGYNDPPYRGRDTSRGGEDAFYRVMAVYKRFYSMYKAQADRPSANACYVDRKDLETRKLGYEYQQDPTFRNFINYNLNRFLWVFARYGTSPTQAIVVSFYIILLFGGFYFFTHTKWDRIDRAFLLERLRILSEYFRSEKSLEAIYGEQQEGKENDTDPFVREMEANRKEVPRFIRILGKGLFFFTLIPRRIGKWFIRRTDFLKGRWQDLSPGRKWIVGTGAFFFSFFYGVYLILLRGLNSFVLSLNSFVTLGFGVIPVSGVARYLTILEGFIGWFLLSIFSISLINQILQF